MFLITCACGLIAAPSPGARRVWLAAAREIIAEPDSPEEPVPTSPGPRQSVGPRRRHGLPSDSGRAGSLVLFRSPYANTAARTKSWAKVLAITVIRRVSLSFYSETRQQRLMMHLRATFSSPPGDLTSMLHSLCEFTQLILIMGKDMRSFGFGPFLISTLEIIVSESCSAA